MPTPPPVPRPVTRRQPRPVPPHVSRRTVVGGVAALAALAASACTGGGDPAGPGTAPSASGAPTRGTNPDVALAAAVLRSEQAMLRRVLATGRSHPALAVTLSGARSAHRAHVALLREAVPDDAAPADAPRIGRVPTRPQRALSALARAEARLGAAGRRNAVRARSGGFARVLASMAAASAQQAAVLSAAVRDSA